jgi:two-component system sensor histidine kinase HydH
MADDTPPDRDTPPEAPALHALKRLFLPLMARAPDAVVIMNATGQILLVNAQTEHWFGYTPYELHGHFLEILIPDRSPAGPLSVSPMVTGLAVSGRRKDGQAFPVEMSLSSLVLEDELFVVCLLRDATARAQEDAAARRTELLVILGQLAATVSHEIRNPLQSLTLQLQLLEDDLHPSGEIAESFAAIRVELARMHSVVADYLSLARVPSVRREPVAVGPLLEDIAQEQHAQAATQRVTLHLEGTQTLGQIPLHLFTFRRAMINLMENALDAMPDGGQLTLSGQRTGSHLVLAVHDTGMGIAATELPRLFTPLYTTKPEGTGLGLYVVQEIVKAHGGTVDATSRPEEGTTFTIRLPLLAD